MASARFHLDATRICPVGQRARIAFAAHGLEFTFAEAREIYSRRQGGYSLAAELPLLTVTLPERQPTRLSDSLAIIELIDELSPGTSLHPSDPLDRARHRDISGLGLLAQYQLSYAARATQHNVLDVQIHRLNDTLRRLNSRLEQGLYKGSLPISNVDVILAPTLWRMQVLDLWTGTYFLTPYPLLRALTDRILPLSAVAEVLSERAVEDYLSALRARGALIADRNRNDDWSAAFADRPKDVKVG
jgi:glutathione S-transferase